MPFLGRIISKASGYEMVYLLATLIAVATAVTAFGILRPTPAAAAATPYSVPSCGNRRSRLHEIAGGRSGVFSLLGLQYWIPIQPTTSCRKAEFTYVW